MKHAFVLGILTAFLVIGCRHAPGGGTLLARVGDEVLTVEQARASIDTTNDTFEHQVNNYVASWVANELLYQEAQRKGIGHTEQFQRDLAEAERQLTIQHFLQQQLYSDTTGITEDEMHTYFQQHGPEFFVREDMIKLNLIAFPSRERASSFSGSISRGSTWEETVSKVLSDSTASPTIVSLVSGKYYSQRTLFPPELWKVAPTLAINEISFPVKTSMGYFVVQALATVEQGKPAQFELVRDEVRDRMLIERRRQRYDELLGTLRKRYNVEIVSPSAQPDTTEIQVHE